MDVMREIFYCTPDTKVTVTLKNSKDYSNKIGIHLANSVGEDKGIR